MLSRALHILLAVIAAAIVGLHPALARAADERPVLFSLSLGESPLDGCGGARALEAAVDERLHRTTFTSEDASDITLTIRAEEPTAKSWRARIVEQDHEGNELGQRDVPLPRDDCRKALDTLAVVLAITIGPPRMTTDPPRQVEPVPAPPVEQRAPSADRRPRPPPPPPRRREPLRWTASPVAGIAFGTGVLPGASWGIEAGVMVRPPAEHLSMIVRAAYWPERATPTLPPADIDRMAGAVLGCWELIRSGGMTWLGCGGGDVSRIEASAPELTRASDRSVTFAALGETRFGYRFSFQDRVFVEPFVAPQVSLLFVRDRFTYRDPTGRERTLLFPAPVALQASFGVAIHFL